MIYRFQDFELHEDGFCLIRAGQRVALEPKALNVLLVLVARAGRLVEKRSLLELVWADTFVEENTLTRTIGVLRRELGDSTKEPRLIETIPTRGYRFVGLVESLPEDAVLPSSIEKLGASSGTERAAQEVVQDKVPGSIAGDRRVAGRRYRLYFAVPIVLVAAAFVAWHFRPRSSELPRSAPVPFTSYRGSEDLPSFSPDGNQVAFEWNGEKQDNFDIYVKALGPDAVPLQLTTDPAPDRWPSYSPDGRTIAFQRIAAPGRTELILVPALGGPERKLAEFSIVIDSLGLRPAWSSDSKWLIVPGEIGEHLALFRVSVETGESTQITHAGGGLDDLFPTVSSDGKTLLFARRPTFYHWGDLYTVPLDENAKPTRTPQPLPSGTLPLSAAVWTSDGKEILAHTSGGVVRLPAGGIENPQPIPWLGADVREMDISRSGKRLVYAVVRGDANVWRIDLAAKTPLPEPLIASTFRDVYPQFSPDGRRIAFHSSRGGDRSQLWVADSEGRQARQLTFVKRGLAGTPHWSLDGLTLVFDSNTTGKYQIYTISPDGGGMKQLTQGPFDNFNTTWSRDGRWMYFTSNRTGRNQIWKMPDGGGAAVQVTQDGGVKGIESQNGKILYFSKPNGDGSIWKIPVEGGSEEQLADSLFRDNFVVAKLGIYYMTSPGENGNSALKLYTFATGGTTTILPMGHPEYGLDVSPDGRYLAYAQLDDPASDLMLVENFH